MLPDSQTQPADQLPILDAVHVQRLPVVLLAGRLWRRAVALVLRQHTSRHFSGKVRTAGRASGPGG